MEHRDPFMAIRTPTLAEIYARQGHLSEAIAIYEHLVAEGQEHHERLDTLRRRETEVAARARHEARVDHLRTLLRRVQTRRRAS